MSTFSPVTASDILDQVQRPALVLDFDGTVCLGDGPVWAYANGVLPHLAPDVSDAVRGRLAAYLTDPAKSDGYPDGYAAVAALAGPHIASTLLTEAYVDSRLALEDEAVDIYAPDGLAELLDAVGPSVQRIVVTNAPSTGLDTALKRLGLTAQIDEVIASADKPASSAALLGALLDGAAPATLMSVGDFWRNDIEPALALGCATAFIDRSGVDRRPAHARAQTIQSLYPAIEAWARSPHTFVHEQSPARDPFRPTPDRSTT